jgi:antitoxin component of RelBE/YafQ-DinJ toxin-antitoxin module
MVKNETIIFRCETELKERLDELQAFLGKNSQSELIRIILDYFIKLFAMGKVKKTLPELEQELLKMAKRIEKEWNQD